MSDSASSASIGKLPILGRLDAVEQLFDLQCEAALAGCGVGPRECAVESAAGIELVADHQPGAVLQQLPHARVESLRARARSRRSSRASPSQPPCSGSSTGSFSGGEADLDQRAGGGVQRLHTHQVSRQLLLARDHLAQAAEDGVRAQVEHVVECLGLADAMLARQPAGEQQQACQGRSVSVPSNRAASARISCPAAAPAPRSAPGRAGRHRRGCAGVRSVRRSTSAGSRSMRRCRRGRVPHACRAR